jgi:hypothetical protein
MSRSRGTSSKIVQLSLFDWDRVVPSGAGRGESDDGLVRLPPGICRDSDVHALAVYCRITAGHAGRYLQQWREKGPWPEDPAVRECFRRLHEQEVGFQAFLAEQTARVDHGAAPGIDLSGLTPEELGNFEQFLQAEVARLDLDLTRALHPDYPIGDVGSRRRLVHWFTLKRSLCSHLLEHLTGKGASVKAASQAPQLHAGQAEGG